MSEYTISLFGQVRLAQNGQPIEIPHRKGLALLAFLALEKQRSPRIDLATMFWPEYKSTRALANLRRTLWILEQSKFSTVLIVSDDHVQLNTDSKLVIDVDQFRNALEPWRNSDETSSKLQQEHYDSLVQSTEIYEDDFLADLHLPDSKTFEDWASQQRQDLRRDMLEALAALTRHHLAHEEYDPAQTFGWRQLEIDPLSQIALRQLMITLSKSNHPRAALALFENFRKLAERESVDLDEKTRKLQEQIHDQMQASQLAAASEREAELAPDRHAPIPMPVFLFTDIEDSTRLWDEHREAMLPALLKHNAIIEDTITEYGGQILEMRGDGFWAVFERGDPLASALAIQVAFGSTDWGALDELRIRIGLHGVSRDWEGYDFFKSNDSYYGSVLNQAARLMQAGWGGQILSSSSIRDALPMPDRGSWQEFGEHDLEGLEEPLHIFGLLHPELPHQTFPELRTLTSGSGLGQGGIESTSPYRGLFAFREEDSPYFFGRESFTELLSESVHQRSMVAVVGPSGSGKSSVVHAGLLAQLRREGKWLITSFRPGNRPFHALAAALISRLEPQLSETDRLVETNKLAQAFQQGDASLMDVIQRILDKQEPGTRFPLVGDQFEELYTLVPEAEIRARFMDTLTDAVFEQQYRSAPVFSLILTLRADFMGQALAHRPFADALQESDVKLGPMTDPELRRAIVDPARKLGVAFEPGLSARILDDVGDEPGNLPLLEFALAMLWEKREGASLTHSAYEAIDRVDGALARHADAVFSDLSPDEKDLARHVFTQVVRPGEGTEDTRRLATRSELGDKSWKLVQRLADSRLLVTSRDTSGVETVEVVHEALIRGWARLRDWMRIDRSFRVWQERLRAAIRQWDSTERDDGALLRGVSLSSAEEWLNERSDALSGEEVKFIQTSLNLRDARQAARERQRRRITIGLVSGLVVTLILAGLAIVQWQTASEERDIAQFARSRQLVAQALTLRDRQLDLALLLANEAARITDTKETQSSLRTVLESNLRLVQYLPPIVPDFDAVFRSSSFGTNIDRSILALGDTDGEITLWDLVAGELLELTLQRIGIPIGEMVFSPDGMLLASGGDDGVIFVWNLTSGGLYTTPLKGHQGIITDLAFSPDSKILASGGEDTEVLLWEMESGTRIGSALIGHRADVTDLKFSPDGQYLVSAGEDGLILLWDLSTEEATSTPFIGHPVSSVIEVLFSPDGKIIASAGQDRQVILWDVSTARPSNIPLIGHEDDLTSLAFGPESRFLASADEGGTIYLWDVATGNALGPPLIDENNPIRDLWFSDDGEYVFSFRGNAGIQWKFTEAGIITQTAALDLDRDVVTLAISQDKSQLFAAICDVTRCDEVEASAWSVSTGEEIDSTIIVSGGDPFWIRKFSSGGEYLALGTVEGPVFLFDRKRGETRTLSGPQLPIASLAFSADGSTLVGGGCGQGNLSTGICSQGEIWFWDLATGEANGPPLGGHEQGINGVALSSDGRTLVSGDGDGKILVWDLETGLPNGVSIMIEAGLIGMALSPEGNVLATYSNGPLIFLWDLSTGNQIGRPLADPGGIVSEIAFSPDGSIMASVNAGNQVTLWDISSGRVIGDPLGGHTDDVISLAFSTDGKMLATGSRDQRVILWSLAGGELAFSFLGLDLKQLSAEACRRANRNLTLDEWEQYFPGEDYHATCPELPIPTAS
ncbi:MAG: hypothetical protein IIC78_02150 [Chloroflexi bacterium]|nr:hypothetical protein [Chloroflexota bacterium]